MRKTWIILLALAAACSGSNGLPEGPVAADDPSETAAEKAPPERLPLPVEVVPVERRDARRVLRLTGTARLWDSFSISSEISGKVTALHVDEGDWVEEGQILLVLDRQRRLLQLDTGKAEVEKARLELDFAEKNLQRGQTLLQRGAISQEEVDALQQAAQLAANAVRLARLRVSMIEDELEDTSIRAPVAGQVSRRQVSLGENILPANPLLTVIQYDPIEVVTEIPEGDLYAVTQGTAVEMAFDALPGRTFRGSIHRIDPVVNPQSGAFRAEIRVPNRGHRLRSGMVARIQVPAQTFQQALIIPLDALLDDEGRDYVFAVRQGKAHRLAIEVIARLGATAVVRGDLQEGDLVVTRGNTNLTEGAPLEVLSRDNAGEEAAREPGTAGGGER